MKKILFVLSIIVLFVTKIFGAEITTAKQMCLEATKKDTIDQSIEFLKKTTTNLKNPSEKRSGLAFLGSVQEHMGFYSDALTSYASAAGIAAGDAVGMPKKSNEQLVLDTVRCALSVGDYSVAQKYLNSAVRNSNSEKIMSFVKLYEQWSILCKAQNVKETEESIVMLKTYTTLESMKTVHPQILLTLWHITGENTYAEKLKKQFPNSLESGIVKGEVQVLPAPFWYFVPRKGESVPEVDNASTKITTTTEKESKTINTNKKTEKITKQQLGLFRDKANAESLVKKLKEKGFVANITSEIRPSGTTYYLVIVDENSDNSMGDELRTAGFECYPIFE